jgi:hypothetical protein
MKKLIIIAILVTLVNYASAQNNVQWINNIKLSGYFMTQYQYSGQESEKSNSFNLRLARISLNGRIKKDFAWKIQLQVNGNTTTLGQSPRVVDLFTEWQKYDFIRIKLGQFKCPFTFENPMNPIEQGFMGYSQNINKLSGFSDRTGEHASNGRDIGIQIQGDFLKNDNGRNLLHYQLGVFNGQGINVKDVDQRKDIIGGLWVMPIKGMRIGLFGWDGSYARKGSWTENDVTKTGTRSLNKYRYAFSAEYAANDWTFRSEYIHNTGYGFATTYNTKSDEQKADINTNDGNKADGVYALILAPIFKSSLHAKLRYDLYRPRADWETSCTQYEAGLNYEITKNILICAEYALINNRALTKHNYNVVDIQADVTF